MFIGHFGVGNLLVGLFPDVPPLAIYAGVSFPDLLWGVLATVGIEKVRSDPRSALQSKVAFESYPYSHSLVLTNLIACVPAAAITWATHSLLAGGLFVLASASHWLLDVVVHRRDLPLLGFGRDIKVGFGLWTWPKPTFFLEYLVYAVPTALFFHGGRLLALLVVGALFHLANANSLFSFTQRNPTRSPALFAIMAFVGFAAMGWVLAGLV